MDFKTKLAAAVEKNNSLLCVGLDPDLAKLPKGHTQFEFNKAIIDATADLVCCYKPNSAFYEADGASGIEQLKRTCDYIRETHPKTPILLDFKRGDIGNTNNSYAAFAFDYLQVDAITIQPYQGREAVQPYLDYADKGIFVLCRTSNPGAGEFQDLLIDGKELYVRVAEKVRDEWNVNGNCSLVVGATYPEEMDKLRQLVGDEMVFLVPGAGPQQGDIEATVKAGLTSHGDGLIINSSRKVLFASSDEDFADAARKRIRGDSGLN